MQMTVTLNSFCDIAFLKFGFLYNIIIGFFKVVYFVGNTIKFRSHELVLHFTR